MTTKQFFIGFAAAMFVDFVAIVIMHIVGIKFDMLSHFVGWIACVAYNASSGSIKKN